VATAPGAWNREEIGYSWPEYPFEVPADWPSGLYAAEFTADKANWSAATVVFFVVRPPVNGPTGP